MKAVLSKYLGKTIGINIEKPLRLEAATLTATGDEHFTVVDDHKGYTHHFTYASVVQVIEHEGGVDVGGLFQHREHFPVVVKVGHLVEYVPG